MPDGTCDHVPKKGKITKFVLSEEFVCLGYICRNCEAELWNPDVQKKYDTWLRDKIKTPSFRDKMKLQKIGCLRDVDECLRQFEKTYFVSRSKSIQSVLSLYVMKLRKDPKLLKAINNLEIDPKRPVKVSSVKLSPTVYFELQAIAGIFFNGDFRACAEEIVNRVVLLISKEPKLTEDLEVVLAA